MHIHYYIYIIYKYHLYDHFSLFLLFVLDKATEASWKRPYVDAHIQFKKCGCFNHLR